MVFEIPHMSKTRVLGLVASILWSATRPIARLWNYIPIHCSFCCHPIAAGSFSAGEMMSWCSRCQRVFETPLLKAPSWVTGVLGILVINLQ